MANGNQGTSSAPVVRSGYNGTGATIPKGTLLKIVPGVYRQVAPVAAVTDGVYGVAAQDITDKSYGLVHIRGTSLCIAAGALTVGGIVTVTAAGKVVDAVSGSRIVGIALEVGSADELVEVEMIGPAGGAAA